MWKRSHQLQKIFKQYNDNFSTLVDNLSAGNAIYDIMQGVDYDIQSYLYDTRKAPKDTIWYQKLIAILMIKSFCLNWNGDSEKWLVN